MFYSFVDLTGLVFWFVCGCSGLFCCYCCSEHQPNDIIKSNFITFNHIYFKLQIECLDNTLFGRPYLLQSSVGRGDATFILREGKKNLYFICYTANFTLGNCIQLYYCPEQ